jgi:hypothetical protein
MVLNENLRFDSVDPTVKRAFLRVPERVLLATGVELYKWTDLEWTDPKYDSYMGTITPWWSFVKSTRLPSGAVADGYRVSEERAGRIGRTHREFARARAAISGEFSNALTNLLVVQLRVPAWGFVGQASGQPEFVRWRKELSHVLLIGGAWQVYVPNLTRTNVTHVPVTA